MHTPEGPNSFNFMQFLGKYGKIVCWQPPGELAPPPQRNPGSATMKVKFDSLSPHQKQHHFCSNIIIAPAQNVKSVHPCR